MIPRHRPPFGALDALALSARAIGADDVAVSEAALADACRVPHALLLPSARAGIAWALESAGARVAATTALTCPVVHDAIARAGARLVPLDVAPGGFLVDVERLARAAADGAALVLCELYGHPYDLDALAAIAPDAPLRVVDLAMTVPTPEVAARLAERDVGVVSLGIGKCCYAGFGGVALVRDAARAAALRRLRDRRLERAGGTLAIGRALALWARTLAHERWLYRFSRGLQELRSRRRGAAGGGGRDAAAPEWSQPSTVIDRAVLAHVRARFAQDAAHRRTLADRYQAALAGCEAVAPPPATPQARSHYTVRVAPAARELVRRRLWRAGVDTGTFFGLPTSLAETDFPHAAAVGRALVNMPLNYDMSTSDVGHVVTTLRRSVGAGPA